jgi:phenylalanyl-tRNA synthetase beta chain
MVLISYDWLKDFIDLSESPEDVADLLIMLGMEVDSIRWFEAPLDRVEVVRVVKAVPHPNADRLLLCTVETSRGELPVVCGAPNVREGMKAAWAPPGLILPGGLQVGVATIRHQESHGMLCSEMELGLTESSEGIIEMDVSHEVGHFASDYLPATDAIFDLEITINRPDLMSHYGVARDLSAKLRRPLRRPIPDFVESDRPASERIKVSIADPDLGPRYCARAVEGLDIRMSPIKIRQRLERCGVRAISNVVDVTNYVMLEYGHPLHAFDFRFVEGNEIIVKRAKSKEKFITLDEEEHTLDSEMLMIRDATRGVALAGIMGGRNSEIRDDTKDVLIECAYFNPVSIRKTAKKLNMMTERSRRFERGMDPEAPPWVVNRAAQLMQEMAGGTILRGVVDAYPQPITPPEVPLRPERVQVITSMKIPKTEMVTILEGLGVTVLPDNETGKKKEILNVVVPSWRPDLGREIDLIEEIARIWGYDLIVPKVQGKVNLAFESDSKERFVAAMRTAWSSLGFTEILTNAMVPERLCTDPTREPVAVKNPVTDEMTHLRTDLLGGLLENIKYNRNRGVKGQRIFEVGKVFRFEDGDIQEEIEAAGVIWGLRNPIFWQEGERNSDFYDMKGAVELFLEKFSLDNSEFFYYDSTREHPLQVDVRRNVYSVGSFGIVAPDLSHKFDIASCVFYFRFDVERIISSLTERQRIDELPRYPSAFLDLSFMLDRSQSARDLVDSIHQFSGEYLVDVDIFDVYEGDRLPRDKKSIAVRLEFRAADRTLVDKEIRDFQDAIVAGVEKDIGAILRS